MAGKFNINQLLSGASIQTEANSITDTEQTTQQHPILKVIPLKLSDLTPSKDNFYSVDKIAELKTSIEMFGVVQPLAVKPINGGKYEIIAGHRRHRACTELVAEGKTEFEYIPCGIQMDLDEIKERILLIMTNSTIRELSDWEKMKQAEELQKYFTVLKKRDNLPGRVRDLVAEALNISSTQVARLNAITNNLTPELKEEFQAERLGFSVAYELSGLPKEKQKEAFEDLQKKGGLSLNEIKEKKQEVVPPTATPLTNITEREEPAKTQATDLQNNSPRPEPKHYPETPPDFEEGQEDEQSIPENQDFSDLNPKEKAEIAIAFLNRKRFALFSPGEDTRVLDFIIEVLEQYPDTQASFK